MKTRDSMNIISRAAGSALSFPVLAGWQAGRQVHCGLLPSVRPPVSYLVISRVLFQLFFCLLPRSVPACPCDLHTHLAGRQAVGLWPWMNIQYVTPLIKTVVVIITTSTRQHANSSSSCQLSLCFSTTKAHTSSCLLFLLLLLYRPHLR